MTLNAAGNVVWMAYFASLGLIIPVCTNMIMLILMLITIGYLLMDRKKLRVALLSIILIGPLTTLLIIAFPSFAGWTGAIFNTIAATPWLYHVIVTKKTSGISEYSIYFGYAAIFCTLIYALMISSLPQITGTLRGLAYSIIITVYYYRYRDNKLKKSIPK